MSSKITISIPDIPENLGSQNQIAINKKLLELVATKAQLEQALRKIRTALRDYESKAGGKADNPNHLQELNALKKLLATAEAKSLMARKRYGK